MNYLVISDTGDYLPIAIKLASEGHSVKFHVRSKDRRNIGKGIVDLTSNIPKNTDIAILDMPVTHEMAEKLSCRVFTSCEFTDFFTSDKEYFEEICELVEIDHDTKAYPDNSIEGWFNGDRFVLPVFYHTYESRLFPHDVGASVPEGHMGIVSHHEHSFSERFMKLLKKLEPTLKKAGYKGLIRLDLKGDVICRPSFRLHMPTIFEMISQPLSQLIKETVNGDLRYIKTYREKAVAVKISIPPYPYCPRFFWEHGHYHINGKPLFKIDDNNIKHLWLLNVYRDNGTLKSSGHSGDLGYVTSRAGVTFKEAGRRIQRTIHNLNIPDLQYRSDIGFSQNPPYPTHNTDMG
jgi:hypothetical protein